MSHPYKKPPDSSKSPSRTPDSSRTSRTQEESQTSPPREENVQENIEEQAVATPIVLPVELLTIATPIVPPVELVTDPTQFPSTSTSTSPSTTLPSVSPEKIIPKSKLAKKNRILSSLLAAPPKSASSAVPTNPPPAPTPASATITRPSQQAQPSPQRSLQVQSQNRPHTLAVPSQDRITPRRKGYEFPKPQAAATKKSPTKRSLSSDTYVKPRCTPAERISPTNYATPLSDIAAIPGPPGDQWAEFRRQYLNERQPESPSPDRRVATSPSQAQGLPERSEEPPVKFSRTSEQPSTSTSSELEEASSLLRSENDGPPIKFSRTDSTGQEYSIFPETRGATRASTESEELSERIEQPSQIHVGATIYRSETSRVTESYVEYQETFSHHAHVSSIMAQLETEPTENRPGSAHVVFPNEQHSTSSDTLTTVSEPDEDSESQISLPVDQSVFNAFMSENENLEHLTEELQDTLISASPNQESPQQLPPTGSVPQRPEESPRKVPLQSDRPISTSEIQYIRVVPRVRVNQDVSLSHSVPLEFVSCPSDSEQSPAESEYNVVPSPLQTEPDPPNLANQQSPNPTVTFSQCELQPAPACPETFLEDQPYERLQNRVQQGSQILETQQSIPQEGFSILRHLLEQDQSLQHVERDPGAAFLPNQESPQNQLVAQQGSQILETQPPIPQQKFSQDRRLKQHHGQSQQFQHVERYPGAAFLPNQESPQNQLVTQQGSQILETQPPIPQQRFSQDRRLKQHLEQSQQSQHVERYPGAAFLPNQESPQNQPVVQQSSQILETQPPIPQQRFSQGQPLLKRLLEQNQQVQPYHRAAFVPNQDSPQNQPVVQQDCQILEPPTSQQRFPQDQPSVQQHLQVQQAEHVELNPQTTPSQPRPRRPIGKPPPVTLLLRRELQPHERQLIMSAPSPRNPQRYSQGNPQQNPRGTPQGNTQGSRQQSSERNPQGNLQGNFQGTSQRNIHGNSQENSQGNSQNQRPLTHLNPVLRHPPQPGAPTRLEQMGLPPIPVLEAGGWNVLLTNGHRMPLIGLGLYKPPDQRQVEQAVRFAIQVGYRHFDCAWIQGIEEDVGRAINKAIEDNLVTREELYITTKVWNNFHRRDKVGIMLEQSLQKMGLDYIDLYLIHWPMAFHIEGELIPILQPDDCSVQKGGKLAIYDDCDYLETWQGMEDCVRNGKAKSIGVANFNSKQLARILMNATIRPVVNQIEVNPWFNNARLIDYCRSVNVLVQAYSPLGLNEIGSPNGKREPTLIHSYLEKIGKQYSTTTEVDGKIETIYKTPTQVVLNWLVKNKNLVVVPKSVTELKIYEYLGIFDFDLNPSHVRFLDLLNTDDRMWTARAFANHRHYPFHEPF